MLLIEVNKNKSIFAALIDSASQLPLLKHIVVIEPYSIEVQRKAETAGISVHRFHEVEEMGRQFEPKADFQVPISCAL